MTWFWIYLDSAGQPVEQLATDANTEGFPTQADAENYIGENWKLLLDAGIDAVTLYENDREVYGPMSLHPEG